MVGRPRFAAAVARHGLRLRDSEGDTQVPGVAVATSIGEVFSSAEDIAYVVLAVKSYDTAGAVAEIAQALPGGSCPTIVTLQNGVGNEECIAASLGAASVIAGVIATPVSTAGPGIAHVEKADYSIGLSRWHPAVSSAAYNAVTSSLSNAGFSVSEYPDAASLKWTKLLMNMVGNASCAILDMPPSRLFDDRILADLEIAAWREALNTIKAAGIAPVNFGRYPISLLAPVIRTTPKPLLRRALRRSVGGARGGKMPSLYVDLDSGRAKSEVSWLNGAVVRKGNQVGVRTPVNRMLTDVLLSLVETPTERELWRGNPVRLQEAAAEYRAAESG